MPKQFKYTLFQLGSVQSLRQDIMLQRVWDIFRKLRVILPLQLPNILALSSSQLGKFERICSSEAALAEFIHNTSALFCI